MIHTAFNKYDPKKASLWPESVPDAVNIASVTTSGAEFASFINYQPAILELERLSTGHETTNAIDTVISADGFAEKMRLHNVSEPGATALAEIQKITAKNSLVGMMYTAAATESNIPARWNNTVRKPSIIDKLRLGIQLSQAELEIEVAKNLRLRDWAGMIPKHSSLLDDNVFAQFDEIVEVSKRMPAISAAGEATVGTTIKVQPGNVYVVIGIAVDSATIRSSSLFSDSFLYLDRDDNADYMQLDMSAMPLIANTQRCYIPAIDKLRFHIGSTTGLTAGFNVRFMYGIRKLTLQDYIKWSMLDQLNTEDRTKADKIIADTDMEKDILAGVIG